MNEPRHHYRRVRWAKLKPAARAAMFRRPRGTEWRDIPPPDLRHAVVEPVISRISPDVNGDVRIHLAAGISVSMPPHVAQDITRFAVRLFRVHQCFVAPQIGSDWSDYVKSKMPP